MLQGLRNLKNKFLAYCLAYFAKWTVKAVVRTCRVEVEGLEDFKTTAQSRRCILMLWHNRLPLVAEFLSSYASQFSYVAFISKSKDGDPLAILADSYSFGAALRVAHNARHQALKKAIKLMKDSKEILLITPDGPKGPLYQIKPGVAIAARETDACVIPFNWKADKYWELSTWDKMRIPKPFSRIHVSIGKPIEICQKIPATESAKCLQEQMNSFCNSAG